MGPVLSALGKLRREDHLSPGITGQPGNMPGHQKKIRNYIFKAHIAYWRILGQNNRYQDIVKLQDF